MFFCVFGGGGVRVVCYGARVGAGGSAAPAISGATSDDLVETMVRVWARATQQAGERVRGRGSAWCGARRGECESGSDLRVVRARHRRMTANFKFKIVAQECGQRRMKTA